MSIASVKHIEDDDEGHFVREMEVVAHGDMKVLLDINTTIADPSNTARFRLKFPVFSVDDDGVMVTGKIHVSFDFWSTVINSLRQHRVVGHNYLL